MQYHTKIHDMMKGRLASSRLSDVTPHLIQQFKGKIQSVFGDEGQIVVETVTTVLSFFYAYVTKKLEKYKMVKDICVSL